MYYLLQMSDNETISYSMEKGKDDIREDSHSPPPSPPPPPSNSSTTTRGRGTKNHCPIQEGAREATPVKEAEEALPQEGVGEATTQQGVVVTHPEEVGEAPQLQT